MMTPPSRPISEVSGRTLTGFANLGRNQLRILKTEHPTAPDPET